MGILFKHASWFVLWRPDVALSVVLLGCAYASIVGPLRHHWHASSRPTVAQCASVAFCLMLIYLSGGTPLTLAAQHFLLVGYVLQMMISTLILPPLILAAIPPWLLNELLRVRFVRRVLTSACHPVVALLVYDAVATGFLLPRNLDENLTNNGLHLVEQMILCACALFLWSPLKIRVRSLPRLGWGSQLVYLFFAANFMMPVPVLLFLSSHPWYTVYRDAPRWFGLSPLADQQLSAVVMMAGMVCVYGIHAIKPFRAYSGADWYK